MNITYNSSESRTHDVLGTCLAFAKWDTFKLLDVEAIWVNIFKQDFARLTA